MSWCVYIQRCHLRLAGQRASIVLIFCCTQVVTVAPTVDWGRLLTCCNVCWYFPGWCHVYMGCWSLCGVCGLLHTRVHFLRFWWLCWTCWHNPTVRYHSSLLVRLSLCMLVICFLWIDRIYSLLDSTYFTFKQICFLFLVIYSFQCSLQW